MKHARSQAPTDVVLAGLFAAPTKAKRNAREARHEAQPDAHAAGQPTGARRGPPKHAHEP